jgi:myo-inositol catabolism protein IolC
MVMTGWTPTHEDPAFILAMDHRESFGKTLFDVRDDRPTDAQAARMRRAKILIYEGLREAMGRLPTGRAGVLVDERYGAAVIDAATSAARAGEPLVVAVPVEASGHEWFTPEWGDRWQEHVLAIHPAYAKVLVRDNPAYEEALRQAQFARLASVSVGLHAIGVPLLYELLVPATKQQIASVGDDADAYDREVRPELVAQVIADNQRAGVDPAIWKVEGLDTPAAAALIAAQARAEGRDADLVVLGRDAPGDRLDHWIDVAAGNEAFVGFAIGRSIWESVLRDWSDGIDDATAAAQIAATYLQFAGRWAAAR